MRLIIGRKRRPLLVLDAGPDWLRGSGWRVYLWLLPAPDLTPRGWEVFAAFTLGIGIEVSREDIEDGAGWMDARKRLWGFARSDVDRIARLRALSAGVPVEALA